MGVFFDTLTCTLKHHTRTVRGTGTPSNVRGTGTPSNVRGTP